MYDTHQRRPLRFALACCATLALASGCAPPAPARATGRLVIVGGALAMDNDEVYEAILDARDGPGPLCVFPTASATPQGSMESAVEGFTERTGPGGATGVWLTVDGPAAAENSAVVDSIRGCSGFFFVGGSQTRITAVFRPNGASTAALDAVRSRFREGAVVSGTSAGAAIMSDPMISGGDSEEALVDGLATGEDTDGVGIVGGLGFFTGGFVDQHFLARGRWGRLLVATLEHDAFAVGFGIDENTALVVDGDEARVAGASGVVIVDGRSAVTEEGTTEGVRLWLAGTGDRLSLSTLQVYVADGKGPLAAGADPAVPDDPFERWGLLHLLHGLAAAPADAVTLRSAGYTIGLSEAPGFRAASLQEVGVEGAPRGLSAGPFSVTVTQGM